MSGHSLVDLRKKTQFLLKLRRAPSQFTIFLHLLGTGKAMTTKEISSQVDLTPKAVERALSKLLEKGLIQRNPFRDGTYTCDSRQVLLELVLTISDLYNYLEREKSEFKPDSTFS